MRNILELNYIIQKSKRRTISIHVSDDKTIIVKVPLRIPKFVAINFIKEKKDWILKQIEKVEEQKQQALSMGLLTVEEIQQLKKKARSLIPERVEYYSKISGISYNRIFIRINIPFPNKIRPWKHCSAIKIRKLKNRIANHRSGYCRYDYRISLLSTCDFDMLFAVHSFTVDSAKN